VKSSDMIRILQVITNLSRGGIETMLMNYYRNIDRNEVQFDFLCNNKTHGEYEEEVLSLGGRIFWTPGLNPFKYPEYLRFFRNFLREHPEYRVIHSHNDAFAAYSLYAAKVNGVPVRISHIHNAAFPLNYKLPIYYICRKVLPISATDLWACGRKAAAFYYGDNALNSNAIHIHNNAIDVNRFVFNEDARARIRKQYGISDTTLVVGHIGRFMKQKNHRFLLEIFSAIHKINEDTKLILVGSGNLMSEIKCLSEKLGIEKDVIFAGSVSTPYDYYQGFDCFLMPSLHEGLPLSGIEAQSADLPCIFSDAVSDEVDVLHNSSFLSLKSSPEAWAVEVIKRVGNHDLKVRQNKELEMRAAGFDIRVEAEKLCAIYKRMFESNLDSQ